MGYSDTARAPLVATRRARTHRRLLESTRRRHQALSRERVASRSSAAYLVAGTSILPVGAACAVLAALPSADRRRHAQLRCCSLRPSQRRLLEPARRRRASSELRTVSKSPLFVVQPTLPCLRRPSVAPRVNCLGRRAACAGAPPHALGLLLPVCFTAPAQTESRHGDRESVAAPHASRRSRPRRRHRRACVDPAFKMALRKLLNPPARSRLTTNAGSKGSTNHAFDRRKKSVADPPSCDDEATGLARRIDSHARSPSRRPVPLSAVSSSNHSSTSRRTAPTPRPTPRPASFGLWSPGFVSTWWSPVPGRSAVARPSGLLVVHRTRRSGFEIRQTLVAARNLSATELPCVIWRRI